MNARSWKQRARGVRDDTYALYLACSDPRVPWYAKACAAALVAYALSPIDLIPDFIPVIGYFDDLLVIPLGVVIVQKMVPPTIWAEHRSAARARFAVNSRTSLWGAAMVVTMWCLATGFVGWLALRIWA